MKILFRSFLGALLALAVLGLVAAPAPARAAFSGTVQLGVDLTNTGSSDLGTATDLVKALNLVGVTFSNGTGANQANQMFADQRTLTASSSEDLDLAGVLTNNLGSTVTFARVKAIIVKASSSNTNNVLVGGASATQFVNWVANASDIITVRPGGAFILLAPDATGYAVTAGTGDLLKIANSGGTTSVTYDIILIGATS